MSDTLAIELKGVKKAYHFPSLVEILKGVDFEVRKGEAVAIMGKSGEGKSTLLQLIGTLEKADSGVLRLEGNALEECCVAEMRNRAIGFIFQSCHLLEEQSVLENVLMPAKIARRATHLGSEAHQWALYLLESVGLLHRASFLAKLLSGGEKQRAAIARALCNNPPLLLADEPTGNLDQAHSSEIHSLLLRLTRELGKTLLVVTHDKELAALCDRTLVLKEGYLV